MSLPSSSSKLPLICFGIIALLFLGETSVLSNLHLLWRDELYTYYQVHGHSLQTLFPAIASGINKMPFVYFLLLWGIEQVTQLTPLMMRMVSALCIVLASPLIYFSLKRYGVRTAAAAVFLFYCLSRSLFRYSFEARPYGLYFLCAALVLLCFYRLTLRERVASGLLCANAFAQFLLPAVHYIGGVYGALAFGALAVDDWSRRRFRPKVYLSFLAGWLVFACLCLPTLRRQFQAPGGLGWIPRANGKSLFEWFSFEATWAGPLVVIGMVVGLRSIALQIRKGGSGDRSNLESGLLLCAFLWFVAPVAFWLMSFTGVLNGFLPRYFIPSILAWIIFMAVAGNSLRPFILRFIPEKAHSAALGLGLLVAAVLFTCRVGWNRSDRYGALPNTAELPRFLVTEHDGFFMIENYYDPLHQTALLVSQPREEAMWKAFAPNLPVVLVDQYAPSPESFAAIETAGESPVLSHWVSDRGYVVVAKIPLTHPVAKGATVYAKQNTPLR